MILQVGSAVRSVLVGDSTLTTTHGVTGVHMDVAPRGAAYPFITFALVTGPDIYTFGTRAWTDGLWQVRAWDERPDTARVAQIMERVDELLTDQPLTVTGHRALVVRRTEHLPTVPEIDPTSGLHIRSAGARFQIGVAKT